MDDGSVAKSPETGHPFELFEKVELSRGGPAACCEAVEGGPGSDGTTEPVEAFRDFEKC
jgi:hypothetical protein